MLQLRQWIILLAAACAATGVPAVTVTGQSAALTPLLPARGAYYDGTKPGSGVFVDVGQDGFVFLAYFGYDGTGAPTWYSIQGPWTPSTEAERLATGVIGRLDLPLLYASGGQCVTCDYGRPPTATVAPYPASVAWTSPRHLDLSIGNQSWQMDAVQYGIADADLPAGTWQLTIVWDNGDPAHATGSGVAARTSIVTVGPGVAFGTPPLPTLVQLDPDADPSIALPPQGSRYHSIDQAIECAPGPVRLGTYGAAFDDIFSAVAPSTLFTGYPSGSYLAPMFWYDPVARRGGLDVATRATGIDTVTLALGPNNVHFDLYVEAPDRIVGHGIVQGADLEKVPAGYWLPGSVMLNLVMQRLPDAAFERSIYPCLLY
jgi:hypothetical protein